MSNEFKIKNGFVIGSNGSYADPINSVEKTIRDTPSDEAMVTEKAIKDYVDGATGTPTLSEVLLKGNTADNSIILGDTSTTAATITPTSISSANPVADGTPTFSVSGSAVSGGILNGPSFSLNNSSVEGDVPNGPNFNFGSSGLSARSGDADSGTILLKPTVADGLTITTGKNAPTASLKPSTGLVVTSGNNAPHMSATASDITFEWTNGQKYKAGTSGIKYEVNSLDANNTAGFTADSENFYYENNNKFKLSINGTGMYYDNQYTNSNTHLFSVDNSSSSFAFNNNANESILEYQNTLGKLVFGKHPESPTYIEPTSNLHYVQRQYVDDSVLTVTPDSDNVTLTDKYLVAYSNGYVSAASMGVSTRVIGVATSTTTYQTSGEVLLSVENVASGTINLRKGQAIYRGKSGHYPGSGEIDSTDSSAYNPAPGISRPFIGYVAQNTGSISANSVADVLVALDIRHAPPEPYNPEKNFKFTSVAIDDTFNLSISRPTDANTHIVYEIDCNTITINAPAQGAKVLTAYRNVNCIPFSNDVSLNGLATYTEIVYGNPATDSWNHTDNDITVTKVSFDTTSDGDLYVTVKPITPLPSGFEPVVTIVKV